MTSREDLAAKVAHAVHDSNVNIGAEHQTWSQLPVWVRNSYLNDARIAVDVLVPEPEKQP